VIDAAVTPARRFVLRGCDSPRPLTWSQEQIEDAVTTTLVGWGRELDMFQKFWWNDWRKLTDDVVENRAGTWLLAKNPFLGGKRPVDLIASGELERVRGAAEIVKLGGGV